ncbi:MAG TPA: response regulator transcription factor [Burkholderiaceae bacterium]|nr:response regulator transcription factor [Burkholderiaceae bacterium]
MGPLDAHPPRQMNARILLVDDHEVLRLGLRQLLGAQPGLEVVADVGTLRDAREALARLKPDLMLLDLGLGDEFSLTMLPRLREDSPGTRILVLSSHAEQLYAERVLRAGAHAFVMKSAPTEELLRAVRGVLAGQIVLSAAQQAALLQRTLGHQPQAATGPDLSPRELEVLRLVADGRSTAEIAQLLHRSVKTIESHKQALKTKLGADSPAQLMRMAIAHFDNVSG